MQVPVEAVGEQGEGEKLQPPAPGCGVEPAGEGEALVEGLERRGQDEGPARPQLYFREVPESDASGEGEDEPEGEACDE